jgi:pentose-5-phosphate-3-epimerase
VATGARAQLRDAGLPDPRLVASVRRRGLVLAGSLLAVPPSSRLAAAESLWRSGAWAHADVIDGPFGSRDSLGLIEIHALARRRASAVDVHLMVDDPAAWCAELPPVGRVTVQVHDGIDLGAAAASARRLGSELWWAVDSEHATGAALELLLASLSAEPGLRADGVLVMLTPPGRSGFSLDPARLDDVRAACRFTEHVGVDGGVSEEFLDAIAEAGARYAVCGRSLFAHGS